MTDAQVNNAGTAQIAAPGAAAQNLTLGLGATDSGTVSVGATGPSRYYESGDDWRFRNRLAVYLSWRNCQQPYRRDWQWR